MTEPASLNILVPIPVTNPSFLYSKEALIIACAKPVIGIIRPHLYLVTNLSNEPSDVSKQVSAQGMRHVIKRVVERFRQRPAVFEGM